MLYVRDYNQSHVRQLNMATRSCTTCSQAVMVVVKYEAMGDTQIGPHQVTYDAVARLIRRKRA